MNDHGNMKTTTHAHADTIQLYMHTLAHRNVNTVSGRAGIRY